MIEVINTIQIPVSQLVPNNGQIDGIPKNPRFIRNDRFEKLVKSIQDNPEFLGARELIVHKQGEKYIVLCGNMRYRASKELNIDQLPCKVIPEYFSLEQIKAIIIKDNISFGSDDMEALANEWDVVDLADWGMEFNSFVNDNKNNDSIDYSDKNEEYDITDFENQKYTIKLEFTEEDYNFVKDKIQQLNQSAEKILYDALISL